MAGRFTLHVGPRRSEGAAQPASFALRLFSKALVVDRDHHRLPSTKFPPHKNNRPIVLTHSRMEVIVDRVAVVLREYEIFATPIQKRRNASARSWKGTMQKPDFECAAMSIDAARAYIGGVSRKKIDELVARGLISSKKLDRRRIVMKASLDQFLATLPEFRSAA